jgi:nitroimidazol reductase NimA-like FMN-containing flavoprotein (pyridoxamine 5'-phosphate oxidase superfamily)
VISCSINGLYLAVRSPVTDDSPELVERSADECYRLLAPHEIERIGVNAEHFPLIFPVNYALDHGVIVIRTHPGTKQAGACRANVSFEVDEVDRRTRSGWSVLVRGLAEELTSAHGAELIERTQASGARPWAPGEHGRWMRIIPQGISGRRISDGAAPGPSAACGEGPKSRDQGRRPHTAERRRARP